MFVGSRLPQGFAGILTKIQLYAPSATLDLSVRDMSDVAGILCSHRDLASAVALVLISSSLSPTCATRTFLEARVSLFFPLAIFVNLTYVLSSTTLDAIGWAAVACTSVLMSRPIWCA